ncbi:F-box protein SKP2A [Capsicum annuum]|nr:F-box protein SKP2A [Capsicum annuum]
MIRSKGFVALATASLCVAASILLRGQTAHSWFKISIDVDENINYNVSKQSSFASLIRDTKLIVWDEAAMAKRKTIEALDLLLKDLMDTKILFGGNIVVLGGDDNDICITQSFSDVSMQKSSTIDHVIYRSATLFGDATDFSPLIYIKNFFGFDMFFAADVRKFMDGGIFVGKLRRPIHEVICKLENKLLQATGREVVLWFMGCYRNTNNLVLPLVPKFMKLQVLTLTQNLQQLEDNIVETIANHCYEFQDLDLSKSFKLTDLSLYALANNYPNLMKLSISGCSTFNDGAIANTAEHCRNLSVLNLRECIKAATDNPLKLYVLNSQMMTKMTLTTPCRLLVIIITKCTLHVNLGWCDKVGDEGVMSLAYGCPHLRVLDLCGCLLITGVGAPNIGYRSAPAHSDDRREV